MAWWLIVLLVLIVSLMLVALFDVFQRRHSILRNFPVVGHLRFLIERIGPELRQYVVADNEEERPFNRDQRRWIYATAKRQNPYFGFGTDSDIEAPGHVTFRHSPFPIGSDIPGDAPIPCGKVLGEWRGRPGKFRPPSVVNISAMSFGSLSGAAISALNRGADLAGCLHNTGEGGISKHHLQGGELVFQIGTGYFGCRDESGSFSMDHLLATIARGPVRAIEVKLSQGAKPGMGGLLPAAKVTREIAAARGVPVGRDVASPAAHAAFHDVAGLVDFVEDVAAATGLPVGVKSAVGQAAFWSQLARHMADNERGPDFVTIDGAEGGTGAGPLVFTDHVALPFWHALTTVHRPFCEVGLENDVVFVGSGKLGLPSHAVLALNLGVDLVNVGREAMMAAGCIQAQKCHTGHCPTGVATQSAWLERGLDPTDKGARVGNYVVGLRKELTRIAHACGVPHPALMGPESISVMGADNKLAGAHEFHGVDPRYTHPEARMRALEQLLGGA
jgi:glutamate synthase domain-containing protein 2